MKRVTLIFLLTGLFSANSFSQWGFVNSMTPYTLDILFLNDTTGFYTHFHAINNNPFIGVMRTTDGGSNWDTVFWETNTSGISGFSVLPPSSVFFQNVGSIAYASNDFGSTWTDIGYFSGQGGSKSSGFIDNWAYYVYSYGNNMTFLRCSGGNWCTGVYGWGGPQFCKVIIAHDSLNIYMLKSSSSYNGNFLKSVNGGSSWTSNPNIDSLINMDFPSMNIGYVVGCLGRIFKTSDGGITWTYLNSPTNENIKGIDFFDDLRGYIITDSLVYATNDGGTTWFSQNMSPPCLLKKVLFPSPNVAYLWTDCGLYSTNYPAGLNETHTKNELHIYPNPAKDLVQIHLDGPVSNRVVYVYDMLGNIVLIKNVRLEQNCTLNTSLLSKGVYLIKIISGDQVSTNKLVIE